MIIYVNQKNVNGTNLVRFSKAFLKSLGKGYSTRHTKALLSFLTFIRSLKGSSKWLRMSGNKKAKYLAKHVNNVLLSHLEKK